MAVLELEQVGSSPSIWEQEPFEHVLRPASENRLWISECMTPPGGVIQDVPPVICAPGQHLSQYPIGEAVDRMVRHNDDAARRFLIGRIYAFTWQLPPYDRSDHEWAAGGHLWDTIRKKTGNDPRRARVRKVALQGKFEVLPYEVKLRFIDDARKASAKKRGGDGKHIARLDPLTIDGLPQDDPDVDSVLSDGEPDRRHPKDGRIESETREAWLFVTTELHRKELASDPSIVAELGPAMKLFRFYLEQPDAHYWTDVEIAKTLGVSDRTIRSYRQRIRFVRKYF